MPHVERLADLQITRGCGSGPPRFCPQSPVTRAEMASFLVRSFHLPEARPAGFVDTGGNLHESDIDAIADVGITIGCRTDPLSYCPPQPVTRGQMATFLTRALGLD